MSINNKKEDLYNLLRSFKKIVVAFSGGVDSTYLISAAVDTLGKENVIGVIIKSPFTPKVDFNEAENFCKTRNINLVVKEFNPLENKTIESNPIDRCYYCKKEMFQNILDVAKDNDVDIVCDGSNLDDEGDFRPGIKALKELGIISPLKECNITKDEIRILSKELDLETYNKPSNACLATRIEYKTNITIEKLNLVDLSETYIKSFGVNKVRVRVHNNVARIEVRNEDVQKIISNSKSISTKLKEFGFDYVTLDLDGYRTGSMNEIIK